MKSKESGGRWISETSMFGGFVPKLLHTKKKRKKKEKENQEKTPTVSRTIEEKGCLDEKRK